MHDRVGEILSPGWFWTTAGLAAAGAVATGIEYSYVIITDSGCGDRGECVSVQAFNGTRPPR